MSDVDISPEAVERLARVLELYSSPRYFPEDATELARDQLENAAATLRALSKALAEATALPSFITVAQNMLLEERAELAEQRLARAEAALTWISQGALTAKYDPIPERMLPLEAAYHSAREIAKTALVSSTVSSIVAGSDR